MTPIRPLILAILSLVILLQPTATAATNPSKGPGNATNPFDPNQFLLERELKKAEIRRRNQLEVGFVQFHGREFLSLSTAYGALLVVRPTTLHPEETKQGVCVTAEMASQLRPSGNFEHIEHWVKVINGRKTRMIGIVRERCDRLSQQLRLVNKITDTSDTLVKNAE